MKEAPVIAVSRVAFPSRSAYYASEDWAVKAEACKRRAGYWWIELRWEALGGRG